MLTLYMVDGIAVRYFVCLVSVNRKVHTFPYAHVGKCLVIDDVFHAMYTLLWSI